MVKMLNILCKLGYHKWKYSHLKADEKNFLIPRNMRNVYGTDTRRKCIRCEKKQKLVEFDYLFKQGVTFWNYQNVGAKKVDIDTRKEYTCFWFKAIAISFLLFCFGIVLSIALAPPIVSITLQIASGGIMCLSLFMWTIRSVKWCY